MPHFLMMSKQNLIDIFGSFPLTKKEIVLSKYIFVFLSIIIGAVIGAIFSLITIFMTARQFLNIREMLLISTGAIFGVSLLNSTEMPCFYKFGMEKGKICSMLIILVFTLGATFLVTSLPDFNVTDKLITTLPIIFVLLTFAVLLISYSISYKEI